MKKHPCGETSGTPNSRISERTPKVQSEQTQVDFQLPDAIIRVRVIE